MKRESDKSRSKVEPIPDLSDGERSVGNKSNIDKKKLLYNTAIAEMCLFMRSRLFVVHVTHILTTESIQDPYL